MNKSYPNTQQPDTTSATWIVVGLVLLSILGFAGYALYQNGYNSPSATNIESSTTY